VPNPAEEHSEGNAMDPMSDWASEETAMTQVISGNKPAPLSPAPVQRQIAGSGGTPLPSGGAAAPAPSFSAIEKPALAVAGTAASAKDSGEGKDDGGGLSMPKWAVVPLIVMVVLGFVYFVLPTALEIFDPMLAKKVRQYTRFQFDMAPRRDTSEGFQINHSATTISQLGNTNGTFYVTGSVENISSANYQQVELKIELYDGQGALLGETLDYTNQLGPNVTWNFKAACLLTNAASAKVIGVIARK
jgi:hypothetical protein